MLKKDFEFEEDYVIECVCEDCAKIHGDEVSECEECGSEYVINETSHEGTFCDKCKYPFDMWDGNYFSSKHNMVICEDCYHDLEKER